jgi:hypothetical protein
MPLEGTEWVSLEGNPNVDSRRLFLTLFSIWTYYTLTDFFFRYFLMSTFSCSMRSFIMMSVLTLWFAGIEQGGARFFVFFRVSKDMTMSTFG